MITWCISQPETSHYFGFAYFRQVKDADIRRGYFQKVRMGVDKRLGASYALLNLS